MTGLPASGAAPATKPREEQTPAERYAANAARREKRRAEQAAEAPTTQSLLEPAYDVAWDDAEKAIEQYKVASGLKMTVFAAEPQVANPVALHIDPKGRFWVVETWRFDGGGPGWGVYDIRHRYHQLADDLASKTVPQRLAMIKKWNNDDLTSLAQWPDRLRRLEDRDGDGRADQTSIFAEWQEPVEGLASGVITRPNRDGGEDVYVTNIPNLWLLRDTNADGIADSRKSLSSGYGVHYSLLGHDLHGLRWGPDGKLYFSNGDRGMHVKTKEGRLLDYPDEGTVMRCDPDGSNLEVIATGLRNPQKLVFDKYGNLFAGDNNCDFGDPARWVYIVEGGDSGWRIGYQHNSFVRPTGPWLAENLTALEKQNTAAYVVPPIAHIGSGPSGCTYYPGVGLPERYDGTFFMTDFRAGPSSVIHSFQMKPKGASFEMVKRDEFVERMVATDIEFGPDGGAYITDWNSGWVKNGKGRIYRVGSPEALKDRIVAETKKLINEGMRNREPRELQALLGHRDMRVRQASQFELAARGQDSLSLLVETALKSPEQLARIHALWGIGQLGAPKQAVEPINALMRDADDEVRAQAAKVAGEQGVASAKEPLIALLRDASPRVRFMAAIALGKLKAPEAIDAIVSMLEQNDNHDAYIRHAGVMGLAGCADVSALLRVAKHPSVAVRVAAAVALRRLKSPQIASLLDDADPAVALEAARAINDIPIEEAMPRLATVLDRPSLVEPLALRALNANFRIGAASNAAAIAKYAAETDGIEILRVQALKMLGEWARPGGQDRVVGVWRPLPQRDGAIAQNAVSPVLEPIILSAPEAVRIAAIELVAEIGAPDPDLLLNIVKSQDMPPAVGAAALKAMVETKDAKLEQAVEVGLTTGKGALRSAAIRQLVGHADAGERLNAILNAGAVADQQAVLSTLGSIEGSAVAEAILSAWMDRLLAGSVAPEAQLDLLESAEKSKSDAIRQKLEAFEQKRAKDDPLSAYRETLVGGDAALGRRIFLERAEVSCLRCHKLEGTGGVAGPDLTGVAVTKDRQYLLSALVDPNRDIAPGFEAVTVSMKAGTRYVGVVRDETEREMIVDPGDGATVHIRKDEVEKRTKGLSPMPQDIIKPLSKRDVRDLVEFLSSLKTPATQPVTETAGGSGG